MKHEDSLLTEPMTINEELAFRVIQAAIDLGISEFCICPGSRNSPFVQVLRNEEKLKLFFGYEERSAAFFALGRSKKTRKPVAIITTSGTAAGELLPAAMEAYYSGIPLLLITADRPRHFRGTGAPQTAEQVGLFSHYAPFQLDIAEKETCDLMHWTQKNPAHLNVCFDEPEKKWPEKNYSFSFSNQNGPTHSSSFSATPAQGILNEFLGSVKYPFVLVSTLKVEDREAVVHFLLQLNSPVFLEGVSMLREDSRLQHLRISRSDNLWKDSQQAGYPIDGVLRIGGVPTLRLWRDLEDKQEVAVCSINDVPFAGLSTGKMITTSIADFLTNNLIQVERPAAFMQKWIQRDRRYAECLQKLFLEEPKAEASLIHQLSRFIPQGSQIYLGNSLPIREWDLAASETDRQFLVSASRGVNGIDGQLSTFIGMCSAEQPNWALIGDLTTLYDMAGPWMLSQLKEEMSIFFVIINNGGGKIFSRMYEDLSIQNLHSIQFEPLANLWSLHYEKWTEIPSAMNPAGKQMIEIVPDEAATSRFWKKVALIN